MLTLEVTAQNRIILELLMIALVAVAAMIVEAPAPRPAVQLPPRSVHVADSHGD